MNFVTENPHQPLKKKSRTTHGGRCNMDVAFYTVSSPNKFETFRRCFSAFPPEAFISDWALHPMETALYE